MADHGSTSGEVHEEGLEEGLLIESIWIPSVDLELLDLIIFFLNCVCALGCSLCASLPRGMVLEYGKV